MIVELPAAVLFASGSAELSGDGRQALQEIAKILKKVPGKRFMVGGHTDDVPLTKNAAYASNWALSAARAVMVTEELIQAGLRAGWDDTDMDIYNDLDPRPQPWSKSIPVSRPPWTFHRGAQDACDGPSQAAEG